MSGWIRPVSLLVLISFLASSCAHTMPWGSRVRVNREPASAYPAGCQRLAESEALKPELKVFQGLVRSELGLERASQNLIELGKLLYFDTSDLEVSRLRTEVLHAKDHAILLGKIEKLAQGLLTQCAVIRRDENPFALSRKDYKRARALCGLADADIASSQRIHPDSLREWIESDSFDPVSGIRQWVAKFNQTVNPETGDFQKGPERLVEMCTSKFPTHQNLEDAIENTFLCVDALASHMYEYNYESQSYLADPKGRARVRSQSYPLASCISAFAAGDILIAEDGTPLGPVRFSVADLIQGKTGKKDSALVELSERAIKRSKQNEPGGSFSGQESAQTIPSEDSTEADVMRKVILAEKTACMPGDTSDTSKCESDVCTRKFVNTAKSAEVPLPENLNSEKLEQNYKSERELYNQQLSRHMLMRLLQGYVVAASQRHWKSPREFNQNLGELEVACRAHQPLRDELAQMVSMNLLDETGTDPLSLEVFNELQANYALLGRRMVQASEKISELRELASLLNEDRGSAAATAYKVPHWISFLPVPILNKLGDQKITVIDRQGEAMTQDSEADAKRRKGFHEYQCNGDMVQDDTANGGRFVLADLPINEALTEADKKIREKISDGVSHSRAFCPVGEQCSDPTRYYPAEFLNYVYKTLPKHFKKYLKKKGTQNEYFTADEVVAQEREKIKQGKSKGLSALSVNRTEWCKMRRAAAYSLMAQELEILALYPALGHVEPPRKSLWTRVKEFFSGEEDLGQTLFERLAAMKESPLIEKTRLAAEVALKSLPRTQDNLKAFVSQICEHASQGSLEMVYRATVNAHFKNDFDYCSLLPREHQIRLGLPCEYRSQFLSCKLDHESERWKRDQEPLALWGIQTGVGVLFDAFFITSVLAGGVNLLLNFKDLPKALKWGGGFSAATTTLMATVTYALGPKKSRSAEAYGLGAAALLVDGVDSYTNALVEIAAQNPKFPVGDIVVSFFAGAMFGGNPKHPLRFGSKPKAPKMEFKNAVEAAETAKEFNLRSARVANAQQSARAARATGDLAGEAKHLKEAADSQRALEAWVEQLTPAHTPVLRGVAGKVGVEFNKRVTELVELKQRAERTGLAVDRAEVQAKLNELEAWAAKQSPEGKEYVFERLRVLDKVLAEEGQSLNLVGLNAGTQTNTALGSAVGQAQAARARYLGSRLTRLLREFRAKVIGDKRLSPNEQIIADTRITASEFVRATEKLPYRERALINEFASSALTRKPGQSVGDHLGEVADFISRFCGLAVWCPEIGRIKGCPR
ncbi:MAG: hypothetical protein AB1540_12255 [Bdellovibrionota bacterium]